MERDEWKQEKLEAIKKRVSNALSAPWKIDTDGRIYSEMQAGITVAELAKLPSRHNEIELILHAPEDIRFLLIQLKLQEKRIAELEKMMNEVAEREYFQG